MLKKFAKAEKIKILLPKGKFLKINAKNLKKYLHKQRNFEKCCD